MCSTLRQGKKGHPWAINQDLYKFDFKYAVHKGALEYFSMGPFAINFDFKSGYHHLDICPHHRQVYRGCSLMAENVLSCLMFFCLDYLLLSIFYQNFKAAGQVLGVQCFHCEVYLDPASNPMKGDLCASGFVINESKSIRTLFKKLDWPGVTLDCGNGTISIKQSRVDKACSIIDYIQSKLFVSARLLSSFLGS